MLSPDTLDRTDHRVDTRVPPYIRIINGALDDDPTSPSGIILLGRIQPSTFRFLRLGDYQRRENNRPDIFEALKNGTVPPTIDIGVRGSDFISDGDDFLIRSPAYIIDGGQRVGSAKQLLELVPDLGIRLFAMLHFNTDKDWEERRFDDLNKNIIKVSSDLHLRNLRARNDAVLTLFGLTTNDPRFPLYGRVSWGQNMQRHELIKAMVLAKTMLRLHARHTAIRTMLADPIAESLSGAITEISLPTFRRNVVTFFSVLDECWPFAAIEYRRAATQLKGSFLNEVARMFSDHANFWDPAGRTLVVSADDRRKLAKFPIADPQIVGLSGSGGAARHMLYEMLVRHMNSGRRDRRLVAR